MKKILVRTCQALVTGGVLVWVFRDPEMRRNIPLVWRTADSRWLLLGIFFAGLGEAANIYRWQIFLRVQKLTIPLARTAMVFMIGVFFSLFMLGVLGGDVVRAAYLCGDGENKKSGVIMSVVVDRLIGMLVLVPFGAVIVFLRYDWFQQTSAGKGFFWFLVVFMIVTSAFFVFAIAVTRQGLADQLPAWVKRRQSLMQIIAACGLFSQSRNKFLAAYALSIPVLFGMWITFYCAARAFDAPATLGDILCIMPVVTIITSLPISFSGIGVREGLFKNLLGDLTGTPAEVAVLISLAGFLSHVCWSLVGAIIWLMSKPARRR